MDECQKEFEDEIKADVLFNNSLERHPHGGYIDDVTQNMFVGFQLAYNRRAPVAQLSDDEIIEIACDNHVRGGQEIIGFAKAIAASVGVDAQNREKACVNTNAESFRRAVDAMQKEKR